MLVAVTGAALHVGVTLTRALVARGEPFVSGIALHALRFHRHTSHAKAGQEVGFSPRPMRETLADTIAWYREAGMLKKS